MLLTKARGISFRTTTITRRANSSSRLHKHGHTACDFRPCTIDNGIAGMHNSLERERERGGKTKKKKKKEEERRRKKQERRRKRLGNPIRRVTSRSITDRIPCRFIDARCGWSNAVQETIITCHPRYWHIRNAKRASFP